MSSVLPSGLGGISPSTGTSQGSGQNPLPASNTFLQLLVAELQNQDPLQPMDPASFMTQMVQLEELSQLASVHSALADMAKASQVEEAVALLGRTVTYTKSDGSTASGQVQQVSWQGGQVVLSIGGEAVSLGQVTAAR